MQIRIEAEAEIATDISDRHADAQLATPCLGPSGIQHPGAQNAELELADAALHAQEQTVIQAPRIVDPLEVNHARFDEPAQFEQVMPAASIAREPRGIQAQHAPTCPAHKEATSRSKPGSATMPLADLPRSSSMISTASNPHRRATSTSSYHVLGSPD